MSDKQDNVNPCWYVLIQNVDVANVSEAAQREFKGKTDFIAYLIDCAGKVTGEDVPFSGFTHEISKDALVKTEADETRSVENAIMEAYKAGKTKQEIQESMLKHGFSSDEIQAYFPLETPKTLSFL